MAGEDKRFDLIITTPHIEDMDSTELARQVRFKYSDCAPCLQ